MSVPVLYHVADRFVLRYKPLAALVLRKLKSSGHLPILPPLATSKSRTYWVIYSELERIHFRVFDVLMSCDLQAKLAEL